MISWLRSARRLGACAFIVFAISARWSSSVSPAEQKPEPPPQDCRGGTPIPVLGKCQSPIEAFVWCSGSQKKGELTEEQTKKLQAEVSVQAKMIAKVGVAAVDEVFNKIHTKYADTPEAVMLKVVDYCYQMVTAHVAPPPLPPLPPPPPPKTVKRVGVSSANLPPPLPPPFTAVAMDCSLRAYDGVPAAASNGTVIRNVLSRGDAPLRVYLELAHPLWNNFDEIVAHAPDVIILPVSAFQEQQENAPPDMVDAGNRKFRAFVSMIRRRLPNVRFLVYSRRWADVPQEQCTPAKVLGSLSDKGWPALETEFRVLCLGTPAAPANFNDLSTLQLLNDRLDELRRHPKAMAVMPKRARP
jgi:hypothetical protein